MPVRIRLLSPKPETLTQHAANLTAAGFEVNATPKPTGKFVSHFKEANPAVLVLDLDHAPSFARQVATAIRLHNSIAHIALVFAGGEPAKIKPIQAEFPDATFTQWATAPAAIKKAIRNQPLSPKKPQPYMDRWLDRPVWQKLGIKEKMTIALLGPPEGFEESLEGLPENVRFDNRIKPATELALWFIRSQNELERETPFLAARLPERAALWLIYPKQSGRIKSDITQNTVRAVALANSLVDYKICAVNKDWSGLKFAHKRK